MSKYGINFSVVDVSSTWRMMHQKFLRSQILDGKCNGKRISVFDPPYQWFLLRVFLSSLCPLSGAGRYFPPTGSLLGLLLFASLLSKKDMTFNVDYRVDNTHLFCFSNVITIKYCFVSIDIIIVLNNYDLHHRLKYNRERTRGCFPKSSIKCHYNFVINNSIVGSKYHIASWNSLQWNFKIFMKIYQCSLKWIILFM